MQQSRERRRRLLRAGILNSSVSDGSITDDFSSTLTGWLGSSGFAVAGGSATITPTENTERVTNGTFESWASATDANSWTEQIAGTSTVNREGVDVHGGSFACRYDKDATGANGSQGRVFQSTTVPNNAWIIWRGWMKASSTGASSNMSGTGIGLNENLAQALTTSYQQFTANGLTTAANAQIFPDSVNGASKSIYLDDFSIKDITLSSMFALRASSLSTNVVVKCTPTNAIYTWAGVAACVDSTSNPQNFILGITNGAYFKLYKCVGGTYTALITTNSATYVAGQTLEIRKVGTTVGLYYNNVQVGTDQTISDAGIISNTYHGLFSGYVGNSFNSFLLAAA